MSRQPQRHKSATSKCLFQVEENRIMTQIWKFHSLGSHQCSNTRRPVTKQVNTGAKLCNWLLNTQFLQFPTASRLCTKVSTGNGKLSHQERFHHLKQEDQIFFPVPGYRASEEKVLKRLIRGCSSDPSYLQTERSHRKAPRGIELPWQ